VTVEGDRDNGGSTEDLVLTGCPVEPVPEREGLWMIAPWHLTQGSGVRTLDYSLLPPRQRIHWISGLVCAHGGVRLVIVSAVVYGRQGPLGPLRSRLASMGGQARAAMPVSPSVRHRDGPFRMEGRHQRRHVLLTSLGRAIARRTGNFHPAACRLVSRPPRCMQLLAPFP
jgi:hypothetical protein